MIPSRFRIWMAWAWLMLGLGAGQAWAQSEEAEKPEKAETVGVESDQDSQSQAVRQRPVRSSMSLDSRLSRLIDQGRISQARALLEQSGPSELDLLFLEARILKKLGRLDEAIIIFRSILSKDSDYLNARRELAHTQFVVGDYRGAEVNFSRLLVIDPLQAMRDGYRSFLSVISNEKPLAFNGYLNIFPSSNLNSGSSQTYILSTNQFGAGTIGNQAEFGVGVQAGITGQYRKQLTKQDRVTVDLKLDAARYQSNSLDTITTSLSMTHRRLRGKTGLSITPRVRFSWWNDALDSGGDNDYYTMGLRFGIDHRINNTTGINAGIGTRYRGYLSRSSQDGLFSDLYFTPWYRESDGTIGSFGVRASVQYIVDNPGFGYSGFTLTSYVSGTALWGLKMRVGFDYGARYYWDLYNSLFIPEIRRDYFWRETITVFHPRFNYAGITPKVTCQYTEQYSNIENFRYPVAYCAFLIEQEF